jgi:hypothetical protein
MRLRNILCIVLALCSFSLRAQVKTEKWKVFELTLKGPTTGNPFTDVKILFQFKVFTMEKVNIRSGLCLKKKENGTT